MAFANVFIEEIYPSSPSNLVVAFTVQTSTGQLLVSEKVNATSTGRGLGQIAAAVKAQVIAWAATPAGGSLTLQSAEVWICGLSDDQITGTRVAADAVTSSAAFADVPNLQFVLAPNAHYRFTFVGAYTAAASTTGLQLSVNGPANPTFMRAVGKIHTAASTVFGSAIGAYDAPIAALASGAAVALPFEITGTISTGAAGGIFSLRFRTEINASAVTILRGSFGELVSIG